MKVPNPASLGAPCASTNATGAPLPSRALRSPLAVFCPAVPLASPPASATSPVAVPEMTVASSAPWMTTEITVVVPSAEATVKESPRD